MKKEVTVKVPARKAVEARPATTKKVARYSCDVCGKAVDKDLDNHYGSGMSECCLCGRDICRTSKGTGGWPKTCYDDHPDDYGDYPRKMCVICLPIWRKLYKPMLERHEKEEEDIEALIKEKSLNGSA